MVSKLTIVHKIFHNILHSKITTYSAILTRDTIKKMEKF